MLVPKVLRVFDWSGSDSSLPQTLQTLMVSQSTLVRGQVYSAVITLTYTLKTLKMRKLNKKSMPTSARGVTTPDFLKV